MRPLLPTGGANRSSIRRNSSRIFPYILSSISKGVLMYKNYLLVAWRNLRRNKLFSFISILGLALGMTCCFLILLYVRNELSYDRFHKNADRIYRTTYLPKFAGVTNPLPLLPPPAAPLFKDFFPEIGESARLF